MQSDRAQHHGSGSDPDPVADRGPAGRVVSDCDLLVDPAVAADGLGGNDGADSMLDEESWTDPGGIERQGGCGAIEHAEQEPQCHGGGAKTVVHEGTELGQGAGEVGEA
ncbi:hypothetical protein ACFQZK_18690 [Rhodococcus aetherivorans]